MIHHRVTLLGLGWLCTSVSIQAQALQQVADLFPLQWKTEIGKTSFKTNVLLHEGQLLVGSNGNNFRDYYADTKSGMYLVNARNGAINHHLESGSLGDMDVNGVTVKEDRLFFGNDNDELFCYTLQGQKVWSIPVSGDVESRPIWVDVDQDGQQELVFATETGEVAAIEPVDGKRVWSFRTPNFSGWKKSDNRFLFKVSTYATYGDGFYREPTVVHLNGDAVPDLVINGRDEHTYAIDGKTGNQLWKHKHDLYRVNNKPVVLNDKKQLLVPTLVDGKHCMTRLSFDGKVISRFRPDTLFFNNDATPLRYQDRLFFPGQFGVVYSSNVHNGRTRQFTTPSRKITFGKDSRWAGGYSADLQLADILGTGTPQLIVPDECGLLLIMDPSSGKILHQLLLPEASECKPLIQDVDGDRKLDLVVACMDGNLYCYSTRGKAEVAMAVPRPSPNAYTCRMY